MKSAIGSILKNLVLLGILALSALNYFYIWLNWQQLLIVQSLVGLLYIFISCYEFLNSSYKASLPVQRFPYFNNSYLMFKSLKIAVFAAFGLLLLTSGSNVKYLYPICFIIAVTEGILTFLKYKRGLCFVNIYANYLLLAQDKLTKIFASEIKLIEYRHNILFLVKNDGKSFQIKLEHIQKGEVFLKLMNEWIIRNQVAISSESKNKISTSISL